MADDYSRMLNIVGLGLSLVGILILFRWGMPFAVRAGGAVSMIAEGSDAK